MNIEFKEHGTTIPTLIKISKNYEFVHDLEIITLPVCTISKEELIKLLEKRTVGFPEENGNIVINAMHFDGRITGALLGIKKNYDKSFVEVMADILYSRANQKPVSGFLVRFIPNEKGELKIEKTFAKIFIIMDTEGEKNK